MTNLQGVSALFTLILIVQTIVVVRCENYKAKAR
jgi:hypothetical protein